MRSSNATVNKAYDLLLDRADKLRLKRIDLRAKIDEKYPYEIYGLKGDLVFDKKKADLDAEIMLLSKYIEVFEDMIEVVEYPERRFEC